MSEQSWHLSKSVPISIIFGLIIQTVTIVWFTAELRFDVNENTKDIQQTTAKVQALENSSRAQEVLLARIDENLKLIKDGLDDLKQLQSENRDRINQR